MGGAGDGEGRVWHHLEALVVLRGEAAAGQAAARGVRQLRRAFWGAAANVFTSLATASR